MPYVDGFLLPIARRNVAKYKKMAALGARIWKEHGALEYRECVGDDLAIKGMKSFTAGAKARTGETVVFAWIVYKSRAHRDRVNAKVMKDPRMSPEKMADMPFDMKRMMVGGFKVLVQR